MVAGPSGSRWPCHAPRSKKGVEALVVIGVEILHILRRAAAVDDVFKRLRGDGMGGKTQHQRAGQRRQA